MNNKYYVPPISSQELEETRNKLNTYIAKHNTKSDSVPLIGIYEGINVFNRFTCKYEAIAIDEICPSPEGSYICIANRKFEVFGTYYDIEGRLVHVWGLDLSEKELKKLVRADRKAHPKAYK